MITRPFVSTPTFSYIVTDVASSYTVPYFTESIGTCGGFTYSMLSILSFASFDTLSNIITVYTTDMSVVGLHMI
jgi:hypothetical protein